MAERETQLRAIKQQHLEYVIYWVQYAQQEELVRLLVKNDADWHTIDIANQFNNLSIIRLPPYFPVEQD